MNPSTAIPAPAPAVEGASDSRVRGLMGRLVPLWRHVVWIVALFVVLAAWVQVRLDAQQMRKDLDRNSRAMREARILNDRLRLEVDARRRAVAMEAVASRLQMDGTVPIVRVTGGR